MMEDCIYQNLSARQWAEKTFRLDEEIADIRSQLNIYKPLLLRLVDTRRLVLSNVLNTFSIFHILIRFLLKLQPCFCNDLHIFVVLCSDIPTPSA